jgi:quinoprotein glucose dehydrogenase
MEISMSGSNAAPAAEKTPGSAGKPIGKITRLVLGVLMVIAGLFLACGGAWLVSLGGSFYYFIAGTALLISGVLVAIGRRLGFQLYGGIFLGTAIWALWEVGFDGWLLMPRILGPAILGLVLLIPAIRRDLR